MKKTLIGLLVGVLAVGAVSWCAAGVNDNYVLGPGDKISITVFEHPEFSLPEAVIRPDGLITHPFLGPLKVSGETPTQLAAVVTQALKTQLRDPVVTVSVLEMAGGMVYVKGEVNAPGAYPALSAVTVARVINLALGLTPKANRHEALIYTPQGEERKVDLTLALGDHAADYVLQPRETLVIPPLQLKPVTVIGEVSKPGQYALAAPDDTVLDALLAAGWVGPNADRKSALLVHDDNPPQRVDIAPLLKYQAGYTGPRLEAGDTLVFPHADNYVEVWGAVAKPGKVLLGQDEMHVAELAVGAELTPDANRDTATLVRASGESVPVDLKAAMDNPTGPANLVAAAGDTLIIATRRNDVLLLGAVAKPGPVPFTRHDTLLDVLTRDGGLAPNGNPDKVSLLRPGHAPVTVSVKKMFKEGDLTNNLPLQVGDTVVVAELHRDVYVFGYVSTPGKYTFKENDRVLDIIARVGVAYGNAAPWESALIRRNGANTDVYLLDLDKLMRGQRRDENYLLKNGDIIFVPKRKGTNWLEWVQQAFSWYGLVNIIHPGL